MAGGFKLAEAFVEITAHGAGNVTGALSTIRGSLNGIGASAGRVASVFSGPLLAAVSSIAVPLSAIGFITKSLTEASNAQQGWARLGAIFDATEHAAGRTVDQVKQLGAEIQKVSRFDDDTVVHAAAKLAAFTSVKGDIFDRALKSGTGLALAMRTDLESAMRSLGMALESPAEGLARLRRAGVMLSEQQEEQIAQLAKLGRTAEAQTMLLDALDSRFGKLAEADMGTLAGQFAALKNQVNYLFEGFGHDMVPAVMSAVRGLREVVSTLQFVHDNWNVIWDLMANETGRQIAVATDYVKTFGVNAFESLSWMANNWREIFATMGLYTAEFAEMAFEQIKTGFDNMVTLAQWFGDNWYSIITDSLSATMTAFMNFGDNLKGFFTALWEFVKNPAGGFNFTPKEVLEGWSATTAQLPEMATANLDEISRKYAAAINAVGLQGPDFTKNKIDEINAEFERERRAILSRIESGNGGEVRGSPDYQIILDPKAKASTGGKAEFFGVEQLFAKLNEGVNKKDMQADQLAEMKNVRNELAAINQEGVKIKGPIDTVARMG
ncbi:MAG: hypothetical protein AB7O68_19985 [Pirellulales bacterium]